MRKAFLLILIFIISLLFEMPDLIADSIYIETGDAGNLLGTAAIVPGGINQINGDISFYADVDLYKMTFNNTADVSVNILAWFDSDVTIFNQNGNPLLVKDPESFTWLVIPGTYYFAIADWDIVALNSSGTIIADDYLRILNRSEVLGGWRVTSSPYRTGPYEIKFSISTVPEPATILLFGLGAAFINAKGKNKSPLKTCEDRQVNVQIKN